MIVKRPYVAPAPTLNRGEMMAITAFAVLRDPFATTRVRIST